MAGEVGLAAGEVRWPVGGGRVVLGVSSGGAGPEVGARCGRAAAKWSAGRGEGTAAAAGARPRPRLGEAET